MGIFKESELIFFVNGKKIIDPKPDPEQTLLYYLRNTLRLCGTKLGCGEGGCGACTVMMSKYDRETNLIHHFAVNACLTPICSVYGTAITTVEGIGSTREKLHPVQERIASAHGSQCGFCTPGIVMSMYALIRNLNSPSMKDLEVAFQGNLCRCTGYRPILEGYWSFTQEAKAACSMGKNCCKLKNCSSKNGDLPLELFDKKQYIPVDLSQEPIFPPELKVFDKFDSEPLCFKTERVTWYRPINLQQLLELKNNLPESKIVAGNSEIGVEVKFKYCEYPYLISPSLVKELNEVSMVQGGIKLGASVSLNTINLELNKQIRSLPKSHTRVYCAITSMLHYFAGKQIRNVASIGGNIMTGSPISDLNPILMASNVELEVADFKNGIHTVYLDNKFYTGYRKSRLNPGEVLLSIRLPETNDNEYICAFKQAKRREDDIAIVTIAIFVQFRKNTKIIEDMRIAFGGMAPTTILAKRSAQSVIGMEWNEQIIERINQNLIEEVNLPPSVPGGLAFYRKSLAVSLLFKGFLKISQELEERFPHEKIISLDKYKTGSSSFETKELKSTQLYEIRAPNSKHDQIGATKVHLSAYKQASGEAVYVDDTPHFQNELYAAYVLSTIAHADIKAIDASIALSMPGVHVFYSASDLSPHQNSTGPVVHDEEIFISKTVTSCGQILGLIVADNQMLAQRAARQVIIEYEEKLPIITIEDAIKHKSFINQDPSIIERGNIDEITKADIIFEDEFRMGGQEHFYLETNATIAIPRDPDELEIICSTQHPTEVQKLVSHMLGIMAAQINVKVKRLGGGFGGKESRAAAIALPIAFAAYKLQRPIRIMLDRDEDMLMTGTRHPFLFKFKVGCTKDGKLVGCDVKIYNNAGFSSDLSQSVLDRSMFHFENAYYIPNVRVQGWCCKTNITTCTAFRGFGGPQGMMVAEHIIRKVALLTKKDYLEIMELNMYRKGLPTHYNQVIEDSNLLRCHKEILAKSNYFARKSEIEKYNSLNRWKKRGISVVPTKFGIAYTALFLNQSGALVHVYSDGSVLISHGGTEMGQGLHTKMIQVASRCLNIPIEKIHIAETAIDKVPNTSPTAASASSDLNGMAIIDACQKILARLEPIRCKYPEKIWDFWVSTAYFGRISLSATGFYSTPGIEPGSGKLFNYFTQGAACSEVEIDCLTGDHQVSRTDIIMDLGSSLNPAIDIGQIEGGFMQGYGLFTIEEMIYSPKGTLYSRGPGMYKIPGFGDIPEEFNVSLLTDAPNPKAVYSSKAVGEPPLFLASSVFFAIKEAISAARKDTGHSKEYTFNSPATSARIRTACADKFTELFNEPKEGTYVPWNIMP